MSLRFCVYKDCENFINLKDRSLNKGLTFFSFPKNPERRQKWMEYGQVLSDLPPSMYHFCSEHFDKKFFGVNSRRTILVGEAVPFPYVEPEMVENFQADSSLDYCLYEINNDNQRENNEEMQNEDEILVESTTNLQDDDHNKGQKEFCTTKLCHQSSQTGVITMPKTKENAKFDNNQSGNGIILIEPFSLELQTPKRLTTNKIFNKPDNKIVQIVNVKELNAETTKNLVVEEEEEEVYEEHFSIDLEDLDGDDCTPGASKNADLMQKPYKRKIEDNMEIPLSKAKMSKTLQTVVKSKTSNDEEEIALENIETEEEIDFKNLLDAKHVTTFIFKGEEYVQMPKDFYIREKIEIAKKLQKMVRSVKAIKKYINNLDV